MKRTLTSIVFLSLLSFAMSVSPGFARQELDQPAAMDNCPGGPFALTGSQETPPVVTLGSATASIGYNITTNTISWYITYSGLTGSVSGAHIHKGDPGVAGSVEVNIGASGLASPMSGTALLTAGQETDLLEGKLYINIHTTAFSGGEVRGQIPAPTFLLSGANEVPPNASTADGHVILFLDSSNTLSWFVEFSGLSGTATGAHFHRAPAGVNGPVTIDIGAISGLTSPLVGTAALDSFQLVSLRADGLYVNLHSTGFPGGELRAQIDGCNLTNILQLPLVIK